MTELPQELRNKMNAFYKAVQEMRRAQKDYFRMRTQSKLTESKNAEQYVDKLIDELNPNKPPRQENLFK